MFNAFRSLLDNLAIGTMGAVSVTLARADGSVSGSVSGVVDETRTRRDDMGDNGPEDSASISVAVKVSDASTALGRAIASGDRLTHGGNVYRVMEFDADEGMLYITADLIRTVSQRGGEGTKR
jgi:hypothetical protein